MDARVTPRGPHVTPCDPMWRLKVGLRVDVCSREAAPLWPRVALQVHLRVEGGAWGAREARGARGRHGGVEGEARGVGGEGGGSPPPDERTDMECARARCCEPAAHRRAGGRRGGWGGCGRRGRDLDGASDGGGRARGERALREGAAARRAIGAATLLPTCPTRPRWRRAIGHRARPLIRMDGSAAHCTELSPPRIGQVARLGAPRRTMSRTDERCRGSAPAARARVLVLATRLSADC